MSYRDEWTVSQTQQQPDESSQDQLENIDGSQIRHGPNRVALQVSMTGLDIEKPGQKAAKRFRQRVDQEVKKGVKVYESGSGYAEPATGAFSPVERPNPKRKLSKVSTKMFTAEDLDGFSAEDQDDVVRPREADTGLHEAPAAKRQNEGKLLSSTKTACAMINILERRAQENKTRERIRLDLPAPAQAQRATASEYPFGGDCSQANIPISSYFNADLLPDLSQYWVPADARSQI